MIIAGRAGVLLLALCLATGTLRAADDRSASNPTDTKLKLGDRAPKFECKDDDGKAWKSEDHVGKKVLVVYFYPADMTGGCTKQACGFRDTMKQLADRGVDVVGVSGDSVKNHQIFKEYHNLNFTLLADEDGAVAKKFGVPLTPGGTFRTKDKQGNEVELKRGVTAKRWTFIIDKDGKIAYRKTEVNAAKDPMEILAAVQMLTGK
jgi:peroxiredoxin Q/BCP